jgi:hypothetical protein
VQYAEKVKRDAEEGKARAIANIEANIKNAADAIANGDLESAALIAGTINQSAKDRDEFQNTIDEIGTLENSSQEYHIADGLTGSSASTSWDQATKAVRIDISPDADGSTIAHELKHAYQFESGAISFGAGEGGIGRGNLLYDLSDEFEGYKRQALFNSSLLPSPLDKGITIENIRQIEKSDRTKPYLSFPSTQQINLPSIGDQSTRDGAYKVISRTFQQAFRANGKTYYPGVE